MSDPIKFYMAIDGLGDVHLTTNDREACAHGETVAVTIQPELLDLIGYAIRTPLPPEDQHEDDSERVSEPRQKDLYKS